jgi:hypothetical protein
MTTTDYDTVALAKLAKVKEILKDIIIADEAKQVKKNLGH